ncbi:MAG: hypothetical protein ABFD08_07580 [Syntrophomonas sp.]
MRIKLRDNWKVVLRTCLSIALFWWLANSFDWMQIDRLISAVNPFWISLAIVWIILSMVVAYVALLAGYHVPRGSAFTSSLLFAFLVSCAVFMEDGLLWFTGAER